MKTRNVSKNNKVDNTMKTRSFTAITITAISIVAIISVIVACVLLVGNNRVSEIGSYGTMQIVDSDVIVTLNREDDKSWHITDDKSHQVIRSSENTDGIQTILLSADNNDSGITSLCYYSDEKTPSPNDISREIIISLNKNHDGTRITAYASTDDGRDAFVSG